MGAIDPLELWICELLAVLLKTVPSACWLHLQMFKSCKRVVHPDWNGELLNGFDIAILSLNGSTSAAPALVGNETTLEDGVLLTATGFGFIGNRETATILQKTDRLMYISNEKCANLSTLENGAQLPILDSMMCAFDPEGSDACQGKK